MRTERVRRRAGLVLAVAAVVLLPACGTRLSDQEAVDQLRSAQSAGGGSVSQGGGGDVALDGGTGLGPDGLGGSTGGTVSAPDAGGGTGGGGTGGGGNDGGGGPAAASGTDTAAGGGTAGGGTAGGTSGGRTGGGGSGGGGGGGAKAPIVLGMVGNFSGVIGSVYTPARDAAAAWVANVNKRGGIDGHPIKLLIADDGNSSSNDLVNARRLVEQEGAIALINFFPASGGADLVGEYAQEKGIAVVGGSGFESAWNKWLTMFPHTTGDTPQDASWAVAMKEQGVTQVGSIHCVEGAVCAEKQAIWAQAAKRLGLEIVYEGQVSLAQPDFTSACTQARSRGAQAIVTIVDGNSTLRYARDCARQQYDHKIIIPSPTNAATPAIEGSVAPIASFPWFLMSGSQALDEYGAAMKKFVDRDKTNTFTAAGWVSGKLMEKALTGRVSDQPKPTDVLEGLYAMKGETLGGLSQPLTFTKGKPAPVIPCAWKAVVQGGKWTAPAGTKPLYCP